MNTLVIGASTNPERYSFKAANRLLDKGHKVLLAGIKKGSIRGINIVPLESIQAPIDTITLYINPTIQNQNLEKILELKPRRIIFNPGTENAILEESAKKAGILVEEACTMVLLSIGEY